MPVAKANKKAEKKAAYEKAKVERTKDETVKTGKGSSPKTVATAVEAYTETSVVMTTESGEGALPTEHLYLCPCKPYRNYFTSIPYHRNASIITWQSRRE